MLASERQRLICQKVQINGQVTIGDLAVEFNVSDETIRRDIQFLSQEKLLRKVRGGAMPITRNEFDAAYNLREEINVEQKMKIATHALSFIEEGDVVALGAGVTIDVMAKLMDNIQGITIITNSVPGLNYLMDKKIKGNLYANIIFIGGVINSDARCTSGTFAVNFLNEFSIDKAFIGATALSDDGVRNSNIDEGSAGITMIANACEIFVVAESKKIGKKALFKVCELDDIHHLITDDVVPINATMRKKLDGCGVQLHIV